MANISISINLSAYDGFKYLSEKDANGKKVFYAAVPVTQLFNPSGTKNVYATAVMIPTPNSQYSDFMLKPMLSGRELQSMSAEDFRAIPTIGSGKYMEKSASKDIVKESTKAQEATDAELAEVFGNKTDEPQVMGQAAEPTFSTWDPRTLPETPATLYYVVDLGVNVGRTVNYKEARNIAICRPSTTVQVHRYDNDACTGRWSKEQVMVFSV